MTLYYILKVYSNPYKKFNKTIHRLTKTPKNQEKFKITILVKRILVLFVGYVTIFPKKCQFFYRIF